LVYRVITARLRNSTGHLGERKRNESHLTKHKVHTRLAFPRTHTPHLSSIPIHRRRRPRPARFPICTRFLLIQRRRTNLPPPAGTLPRCPPLHHLLLVTPQHPQTREPGQDLRRLVAMVELVPADGRATSSDPRASQVKGTSSTRRHGAGGEDLGDAALKLGENSGRLEGCVLEVVAAVQAPPASFAASCCRSPLRTAAAGHHSVLLPSATSQTSFSR
jgi:hypothetical protein